LNISIAHVKLLPSCGLVNNANNNRAQESIAIQKTHTELFLHIIEVRLQKWMDVTSHKFHLPTLAPHHDKSFKIINRSLYALRHTGLEQNNRDANRLMH